MKRKMKIIRFTQPGPPEVLKYVNAPIPKPQTGEVLVRAHCIGVGIPDTRIRSGVYDWMPPLPVTPGTEMSGTVEKLGPGVTSRQLGQHVIVSARERPQRGGCYAEYIATPADGTFVIPDGVGFGSAACLANYQVAYHLLGDGARVQKGQSVLIYGAAGGMGNALIDLARESGLKIIGVASDDARARFARELGADHVVNRRKENIAERVKAITGGKGVDIIVDPVGGPTVAGNLAMLATMGMLVIYGMIGGDPTEDMAAELRKHNARCPAVRRFSIHYLDRLPDERRAGMHALIDKLAAGVIRPRIGARLKLAEAVAAHKLQEAGKVMGKLLLVP